MTNASFLKVMVLAGGPDRERPVSLRSGQQVANALERAGHQVMQADVLPDDLSALDQFAAWGGDVIFPVLHGPWGEGGQLQQILEGRSLRFVGSRSAAAALCMDKLASKRVFEQADLPTPSYQQWQRDSAGGAPGVRDIALPLPVVVKPPCEGSSIDLTICHDRETLKQTLIQLAPRHDTLLIERFVAGKEMTVGIVGKPGQEQALPAIHIVPATAFYDYDAKYERSDTQYLFEIDEPAVVLQQAAELALSAHRVLGCRHLSRVDMIVDQAHRPWILEVNTIPGFTDHSLLPMAARQAGWPMPTLVDRLVRMAAA